LVAAGRKRYRDESPVPVTSTEPLTCQELVELVTDYLEDALPAAARTRFDSHLSDCDACLAYLRQLRATLDLLGRIEPEDIDQEAERTLLGVFRSWNAGSQTT
jgi:anti-sigma factor RsiW